MTRGTVAQHSLAYMFVMKQLTSKISKPMKLMKEKYETRRPTSRCVDVGACFNVTGERTLLMKSKNERVGCLLSTLKDGPHEPSQSHGLPTLQTLGFVHMDLASSVEVPRGMLSLARNGLESYMAPFS